MVARKYTSWGVGSKAYTTFKGIKKGSSSSNLLKFIASKTRSNGGVRYKDIKSKFHSGRGTTMGLDRTLRRLETSSMISRPRTGYYIITRKGKAVLYDLMQYGSWRK